MSKWVGISPRDFSKKALRNAGLVLKGSASDAVELMSRRAAGTSRGGSHKKGFVPVDTGELVNSLSTSVNGAGIGAGAVGYGAFIGSLEWGDSVEAVFTAEHARYKEYGHGSSPGWFFVRGTVQKWPAIVAQNAAQFR